MKIEDVLKEDCIIEKLEASTRKEALMATCRILLSRGYVKETESFRKVYFSSSGRSIF